MEDYNQLIAMISLSMGVAWASGLNLYAAILTLGIMSATGNVVLPPGLEVVADPMVIAAAGFMYCVEFFADKTPGVDSAWDAMHTFVRVPAGAILAAGAVGDMTSAAGITAGLLGGGMALTTHSLKAGTRVMINSSPEPVTNWTASITEDLTVVAGLWAALNYPELFVVFLIVFIILMIWLLPKLWVGIKTLFSTLGRFFSGNKNEPLSSDKMNETVKIKKSVLGMEYDKDD